jgi:hypothetical protein
VKGQSFVGVNLRDNREEEFKTVIMDKS